jgi:hypothetical protein
MEEVSDIQTPEQKIYKDRAIYVGTFIGGPLVAGYLIAENFRVFNEPNKAKKAWIYAIGATIIVFGGVFLIPNVDKVPRQVIPLIYTWIAYYLVKHYQGANINAHINAAGKVYNWWRTLGIALIGLLITLTAVFSVVYFSDKATNNETVKTYGVLQHEIHFDKSNISEKTIDKIAEGLTVNTFFDSAQKKEVYVKLIGRNYELSIPCDQSIMSHPEIIAVLAQLRDNMQKMFPANKIVLNLVGDSLDNVIKRLK